MASRIRRGRHRVPARERGSQGRGADVQAGHQVAGALAGGRRDPQRIAHPRAAPGSRISDRSVGARDAILEAVAHAAERLLLSRDWLDAADDVLARLGLAADVSRAYVIENHVDAAGRARCRQLAEWCAPGVAPQMGNPALDDTPWDEIGFARWVEVMSSGGSVSGPVVDLPKAERAVLRDQEILSLASFPVFVDDRWWGLIG